MASKSRICVVSRSSADFCNKIDVDDTTYHVQTEDNGRKSCKIISRVYLKGEIVFSKKSDYSHLIRLKYFDNRLRDLMTQQHKSTIDFFTFEKTKKPKLKSEYIKDAKYLLLSGNKKSALNTLKEGLDSFPSDPFLLSFYGFLISSVEDNPVEGVKICKEALLQLNRTVPIGSEFYHPVFYLNLGKAYLTKSKFEAINCFRNGLKNDPENKELVWELQKLGTRRKTAVPFLRRSNPINKYIGLFLRKAFM